MFTIKRTTLTAALLLFSITVFAVDEQAPVSGPSEPADTEIILPRMYLEIEDLTIEEIDAVIPDDTAVMLSTLELKLPEPEEIEIPVEAFALTDVDVFFSTGDGRSEAEDGGSFFSEATIGAGTSARINGDINLYHIGEQPDFRLKFFHDSSDGFAGREAGEGFSAREELIEAELNYTDEKIETDLLLRYNEFEDGLQGLQGNTDFFTVTRRLPELAGSIDWKMSDLFKLTGDLDASMSVLQLNALEPLSFSLFSAATDAGIVFGRENLNIGLSLNYGISGETTGAGLVQQLGADLSFTLEPADIFNMTGRGGLIWNSFSSLYYPFKIDISGSAAAFEYELSGGYAVESAERSEIWKIFPTAGGPAAEDSLGELPFTTGWFVDGGFRWNVSDRISMNASAGFSMLENALIPSSSVLTGFNALTAVNSTCLDGGVGLYVEITDGLSLGAGWNGQMLEDLDWFRPKHEITGEFELVSADREMGIIGDASFAVYDERQSWYSNDWLPMLGLEGYLRLSEGFVLSVSGEDLAAGLLDSGRNAWNGYLEAGAMLQAKIKISL